MNNNIDVLGAKLSDAIKKLEELGIIYTIIKTKPFKLKTIDEGFTPVDYIVKQEWTNDKKLLLVVTTKYRKEV